MEDGRTAYDGSEAFAADFAKRLQSEHCRHGKRLLEVIFTLFLLVLFALPMLVILSAIFFSDVKASPIFCQERVGKNGKPFKLYKFRTMVPDAEQLIDSLADSNDMTGPVFKMKNDPRVTRLGRFLRARGLDELPQLFNVLNGSMALVGPRPPLPCEVSRYNEYQKLRLSVLPGITCTWQVCPDRYQRSFDEWLRLDIEYILHRSVFLDIKIILLTAASMVRGDGI